VRSKEGASPSLIGLDGECHVRQRRLLNKGFTARMIRAMEPRVRQVVTEVLDELAGQRIAEGEKLLLVYQSANRDGAVFEDPDILEVDRDPNPHRAFGVGPHLCMGTNRPARRSGSFLEELTRRFPYRSARRAPRRPMSSTPSPTPTSPSRSDPRPSAPDRASLGSVPDGGSCVAQSLRAAATTAPTWSISNRNPS
jgi:cytochrome P450